MVVVAVTMRAVDHSCVGRDRGVALIDEVRHRAGHLQRPGSDSVGLPPWRAPPSASVNSVPLEVLLGMVLSATKIHTSLVLSHKCGEAQFAQR